MAKPLKSPTPETQRPATPRATYPTPSGCPGSSLQPCERCGAKWSAREREEIDGEETPVYHRTFLVEDVTLQKFTYLFDPELFRVVLDIWPVLPIVKRRWLCIGCYHHVWEIGLAEWCHEQREAADTSRSGAAIRSLQESSASIIGLECELEPETEDALRKEIMRQQGPGSSPARAARTEIA